MKKFDAVVIGDANIDLVVTGFREIPQPGQEVFVDNIIMHVGGGAALFSLSLAKLGLGVAFNGVLGDDVHGRYIREQFAGYGIDTSLIRTSKTRNTGISIAFNPDTDRSFITYGGSNMELDMGGLDLDRIIQGKHVHMTGYKGRVNHEQFVAAAKSLKERGVTLSCDVGWDDSGEWFKGVFEFMRHIDVFLMNETEALHYTGCKSAATSLRFLADYCGHVVIKLGSKGAAALKDGTIAYRPAYTVETVDTTGAGDSFNAGYLFGFLTDMDVETCLQYGNACGALSVGAYGGSTGTPDRERLHDFIRRHADQAAEPPKGGSAWITW